ncbi:MFS general substrate transporter [Roridomyces roridus]|uniref:MFS general substrate transporter n=1 Tax=Roridomyces roridus TaxID=1738132 RepID=A0AAD7BB08_9AGAR|nr:MFS general substrate transporter [Roridomyces roridus]
MGNSSEFTGSDEKHEGAGVGAGGWGVEVSADQVDTAAALVSGKDVTVSPEESVRIRNKIDRHILPFMCVLYWMQYMDKNTLASSSILGIKQTAHLTTNEYNWLGTVFYLSYLVFQFPQNLALQRFPVAKWLSFNIFVWAVSLCTHAACKNFAGLMVVRIMLGMSEGCIITGFLIVTSMFYTHKEQTVRVGYWYLMNGFAQIASGFISFGTLHITTDKFQPWQWLMIITGGLTLITAVCFWFFFPDSPTTAWFLTPEERILAVMRIKENRTGVENKRFKKEQMFEALRDPKTWLFALFAALVNVPNSVRRVSFLSPLAPIPELTCGVSNQKPLIINSFGFTVLQTTLLTIVDGAITIITVYAGVHAVAWSGQRAYTAFVWKVPEILGAILVNALPWSNRVGLLCALWVGSVGLTGFVIALAWISAVTAGHTKRVTTNAIVLCAYCIGNAVGPFMWLDKYKPRNRVPWIIIGVCYLACMFLLLIIRYVLAAENKRRDREAAERVVGGAQDDQYEHFYVERVGQAGVVEKVHVDKEFLDLTDWQNRDFRYVL